MVASAGLAIALLGTGLSIPYLFLVTGILNAVIAIFIYKLVPEFLMRFLAWILIHTVYRVHKEGLDNVPDEGGCIVVCNHVSYVDAMVIAACVRAADPLRDGPPHLSLAVPELAVPHDAGDPGRVRARGPGAEGSGASKPRARALRARRGRRHLSGRHADAGRRDRAVSRPASSGW